MRCIHLSERLQISESAKSHLVDQSGTAWQVSAQLPSRNPGNLPHTGVSTLKKILHPTTEILASSVFMAALVTMARKENRPSSPPADELGN